MMTQTQISSLGKKLFGQLLNGEDLVINFKGEETDFLRFNQSKIRQQTLVKQNMLTLSLQRGQKKSTRHIFLAGRLQESDESLAFNTLLLCRQDLETLPPNPHLPSVIDQGTSSEIHCGSLLKMPEDIDSILAPMSRHDGVGIFVSGPNARGTLNNKGTSHWYQNESFYLDYSFYAPNKKAVKNSYSSDVWNQNHYEQKMKQSLEQLPLLQKEIKKIPPGKYRTYLSPKATAELLGILNWDGLSYAAYKRGHSPLRLLVDGEKHFSPQVTLSQDFSLNMSQRFNELGELSPSYLDIITQGKLGSLLISTASAKEYLADGIISNFASPLEMAVTLSMDAGELHYDQILQTLGTGFYISDLWYLNWSDRNTASITGMTRYACFWVEDGKLVAPIENMRFDENLYHILGSGLLAITREREIQPNTSTYFAREIGGSCFPGLLVNDFSFTL